MNTLFCPDRKDNPGDPMMCVAPQAEEACDRATPPSSESQLDRDFWTFHEANPGVFELFAQLAEEALRAGEKVGARCIGENIRWKYRVVLQGRYAPKFNDHHWPRYARLLANNDPRFSEFFEFRKTA